LKQSYRTILLWVFLLLTFVLIYRMFDTAETNVQAIAFSDFRTKVKSGEVKEVKIRGNTYAGKLRDGSAFKTFGIVGEELDAQMWNQGDNPVRVEYEEVEQNPFWQSLLISWLPMVLIFVIFIFFMRQFQSGGGKAMSFGKSKAKLLSDSGKKATFEDVAGVEEAKEELQEVIAFLKDPKKFTRLGGRIPKGVLLVGPPGTGKTLLARAVAGEAGVPFFSISGSDFVEMFVGVGASRVRDLFEQGKKHAPCIVFIDELDAVGRHRGAGLGGGHDEREQTLNQLLVEMDGFESNEGVILMAATNRPDVLDPALLRPGRFDRRVVVPRPDVRGREAILKVHTRRTPLDDDVDVSVVARGTPGFSGADLENLVNEAALLAARHDQDRVRMHDFELAKDKVLMGSERKSMVLSAEEKRTTAYHEAGHAMVAWVLPNTDPIHKVSVIPRGMALGLTQQLPTEDRYTISAERALEDITVMMGGRVAEEMFLEKKTTGAGNDLERATELARKMVCEWGMSEKLGPLTFGKVEEQIFLGKEFARHQDYSENTAKEIDAEVRRIVTGAYDRAHKIVDEHREQLERLAQALLEREVLDGEEIELVMTDRPLPDRDAEAGADASGEGGGEEDRGLLEKGFSRAREVFGTGGLGSPSRPATDPDVPESDDT